MILPLTPPPPGIVGVGMPSWEMLDLDPSKREEEEVEEEEEEEGHEEEEDEEWS